MTEQIVISLVHLGCPKNLIDTEKILGQLATDGYLIAQEPEDSDVILINTCGFIKSAREEARDTIEAMLQLKAQGNVHAVIAVGCMVQLYSEELQQEFPELDGLIGFGDYSEIGSFIQSILEKKDFFIKQKSNFIPQDELRLRVTYPHFSYLRLTEGCSNWCSYCTIPKIRGEMRSKPEKQVIEEARMLVADGVKELIVIGQDTGSYGTDLTPATDLYRVVEKLSQLKKLQWMRIMYIHPIHLKDKFIDIFSLPKVLPYLEMPLQHINSEILNKMGRAGTTKEYLSDLIDKIRQRVPNIILRTTLMVGFPGETEEIFQELLDFVAEKKIERLGAFTYSSEPGTKAAKLPNQVAEEIKQQRYQKLMELQQQIAFEYNESMIGQDRKVLIEEQVEKAVWKARSYGEAPDIDPCIYVQAKKMKIGKMYNIRIVGSQGYDLVAKTIGKK